MKQTVKEFRKYVSENIDKLPPITKEQEQWFYSKLDYLATTTRGKFHCLECGYKSNLKYNLLIENLTNICPNCNKKVVMSNHRNRIFNDSYYGSIITTFKGIQIIRIFFINVCYKRNHKPIYFISEVIQHWINSFGKNIYVSKNVASMTGHYDSWYFSSELKIKNKISSYSGQERFLINSLYIYPKIKTISILKRNGFKTSFNNINPIILFTSLLKDNNYEILYKLKQFKLIQKYENIKSKINMYWKSIMICCKNNYIINDPSDYFDYLQLLEYFYKDLYNTHYICPEDLHKQHQHYLKKKNKIQKEKEFEILKSEIKKNEKSYKKKISPYMKLSFVQNNIHIEPIKTVKQLFNESSILNHCAFVNEYYKKSGIILFSAKINNEILETIEYSLKEKKVIQARGLNNKISDYHDEILNIIDNNKKQIKHFKETI
jgi:hypothetical protein